MLLRDHCKSHQPVILPVLDQIVLPVKLHHGVGELVAHQLQECLFRGPETIAVPNDLAIGATT